MRRASSLVVYGSVLVLVIAFAPHGLTGLVERGLAVTLRAAAKQEAVHG